MLVYNYTSNITNLKKLIQLYNRIIIIIYNYISSEHTIYIYNIKLF